MSIHMLPWKLAMSKLLCVLGMFCYGRWVLFRDQTAVRQMIQVWSFEDEQDGQALAKNVMPSIWWQVRRGKAGWFSPEALYIYGS